jgi:hypothetical protein
MVAQMEERRSEKPEVASSKLALPARLWACSLIRRTLVLQTRSDGA